MKKTLLALAIASATMAAQADVKLSGNVNTAFGDVEEFNQDADGNNTGEEDLAVNNAPTAGSRFRIVATTEANGITYGLKQELGFRGGSTGLFTRVNETWIKGGLGKFSLGQGSEASDGVMGYGTPTSTWVTWNDISTFEPGGAAFGSYEFIDGGRTERIRYDSPKFAGLVTVSVDRQRDDDTSAAVRIKGSNFGVAAYTLLKDEGDNDEVGIAAGGQFGMFVVGLGTSTRDESGDDTNDEKSHTYVNFGVETSSYGVTLDHQIVEVDSGDASELTTTGLNFTYKPTKGVTLYASLRQIEEDVQDVEGSGAVFGTRIVF